MKSRITTGATIGAAAGLGLWWVFTTRSAGSAVAYVTITSLLYALLALALTPRSTQTAPLSTAACAAVLPGAGVIAAEPAFDVPAPRAAEAVA